jgi:hypothetical protein
MLIVTYSLVTLSVEQEKTRHILSKLQQHSQHYSAQSQCDDLSGFTSVLHQFAHFDESCRRRNVELYVIPAIRRATQDCDELLIELDELSKKGASILETVRIRLQQDIRQGMSQIKELAATLEQYCHYLLTRLAKEEGELFPIARRVITSEEAWFAIAAQFISHDAEVQAGKAATPPRDAVSSAQVPEPSCSYFVPSRTTPALELHY